jgi:hypothetical protein
LRVTLIIHRSQPPEQEQKGRGTVKRTFGQSDTGAWIEGTGLVRRLIADDNDGARHQRFILDLRNGQTVLMAHNIDLAERVPVGLGDRIRFRGMYEWNEQGGLVHWTHHDPLGLDDGGYIRYRSKIYL